MFCLGNEIGSEGALALAESLKQNTTLTNLNLKGTSESSGLIFTCVVILICGCFVFRERDWLRGSAGSGRVSETEHDPHQPESQMYVRIEWTYICMRVVILICGCF